MNYKRIVERTLHLPRRILRETIMVTQLVRFFLLNRLGKKAVIEQGGPVVSLTTYGPRARLAYVAIESIAAGSLRPSELLLWIDDISLIENLPKSIRRLQKRGLTVGLCGKFGPHAKYYPYIQSKEHFERPLVVADDDVSYPSYWLERLAKANRERPNVVNCYAAHIISLDGTKLGRHKDYVYCHTTIPSFLHIAIASCGIILPTQLLTTLKAVGTEFMACCFKQDDLWRHLWSLRNGYKTGTITAYLPYYSFQEVLGTQRNALKHENQDVGRGNDRALQAIYLPSDIEILQADARSR